MLGGSVTEVDIFRKNSVQKVWLDVIGLWRRDSVQVELIPLENMQIFSGFYYLRVNELQFLTLIREFKVIT